MTESERDRRDDETIETFASLADTLTGTYDVVELLQTLVEACARLVGVSAAGILLADEFGDLEVVASTSEASRLVEAMQVSANAGPCVECFRTGLIVSVVEVADSPEEWSLFRTETLSLGFHSVYAIPLRLREATIGTLNLLRFEGGELDERDVRAAQALADVATIGVLHERAMRDAGAVQEELARATTSRAIIEQAKGVISYQRTIGPEEAFALLRQYARSHRMLLSVVAESVVQRELTL